MTRYSTLRKGRDYSLLEVELDTGRKNQIRVHMKDLGHPISGDRKYGAAARLFIHPITRKEMSFATPIPASFLSLARR